MQHAAPMSGYEFRVFANRMHAEREHFTPHSEGYALLSTIAMELHRMATLAHFEEWKRTGVVRSEEDN
jgi:hypothetical protein